MIATNYLNTTKSLRVEYGLIDTYYSYATPVAFRSHDGKLYVSENVWSRTTGKHLTQIDGGDRKSRIPHDQFEKLLNETRKHYNELGFL
tara:strand:- start:1606 stop:1872 length:267 start_codon:yes stop_codon:yes gene_type:complete